MTAPAVKDVARPTGHISQNVSGCLRRYYSLRYVVQYIKMQLIIKSIAHVIKQNANLSIPGFASVHGPDPEAVIVSAAKRNPVSLSMRMRAEKGSTTAMEMFGLPIAIWCRGE